MYMYNHKNHRLITLLATIIAYTGIVRAQTRLSGAVIDSVSHQNMEGASVRLLAIHGKDTTPVAGVIAKNGGRFTISRLDAGTYHLYVSFQGYEPLWRLVTVGDEPEHLNLFMYPAAHELQGLLITDTRQVRVHGDTTAFNADQFHTAPHATLGELMNKMPGIDMSHAGMVRAQGDTVKRILVNGKRFFSNDLQLALKNLPRDVVASVEIFDDKSDQAKFTGVDDGIRIRTINIVLKKSVKSGVFGKASLEAGTAVGGNATPGALYKGEISANRFRGENMTSLVGNFDNTRPMMGGIAKSMVVGVNYSNHWGQHTQVSGSYVVRGQGENTSTSTYTQNLLPGDSTINSRATNTNSNHSANQLVDVNLETDPSKYDHLTLRGRIDFNTQRHTSGSQTSSVQGVTIPLNRSITQAMSQGHDLQSDIGAIWGHRFAKAGRSASLEADLGTTNGSTTGDNKYDNAYFKTAVPDSVSHVNQYYSSPNDHLVGSLHATYEEPLLKNNSIQLEYVLSTDQGTNGRTTYDLDSLSGKFDSPDSTFTNHFKNSYRYQQGGLKYHYGDKKIQITAGMGLQEGVYRSADLTRDTTLKEGYTLFHPMASLNLNGKNGFSINLSYDGRGDVPSINQLQPIVNNTNPLNIVVGNPNLRQSFSHVLSANVRSYNPASAQNFMVYLSGNLTENSIVTITHVNAETGIDTTTYINLNGTYMLAAYLEYGLRLKHPASNLSFDANIMDHRSDGYINTTPNTTTNYYIGANVRWTTNLPNHIDMNVSYNPLYQIGLYSAEPAQNTHYLTHSAHLDALYYTDSGWQFGTGITYSACTGRPVGFNPTSALWDLSVSKFIFARKGGEIKFSLYNILDQASQVNGNASATQIQNTTGTMLGRYMLLGFIYHLSPPRQ